MPSSARAILFACCAASLAAALRLAPHPRLILTPERLADVQAFIANSSQAAAYYAQLQAQGAYVLPLPPLAPPPANASSILSQARAVLTRTYVLSLLYRLSGDESWAARAAAEMLGYATWPSWNLAGHALDTGELSHAAAIGLDWTDAYLSQPAHAATRAAIVAGLVARGMHAFADVYAQPADKQPFWVCGASNWGVVTNAGAGLSALALLGDPLAPPWIAEFLANATRGVRCSAASPADDRYGAGYAPEGAW